MGMRDEVDHPRHYMRADIGRECIEFNRDMPYCMGNAFKYAYRAGLKGSPVSDWGKCLKYLTWQLESWERYGWAAQRWRKRFTHLPSELPVGHVELAPDPVLLQIWQAYISGDIKELKRAKVVAAQATSYVRLHARKRIKTTERTR